jgi:XTP/dITP diphosphohydrolase
VSSRVLLATRNPGKIRELHRIVAELSLPIEVLGLDDVPAYEPGPETGATFADNALAKAREAVVATGLPALADDSGLAVDAMNGMPGVLSARWAGRHGDDPANLDLVLGQLADVPDERRGGAFVCAAALVTPGGPGIGSETVTHGEWRGELIRAPRGTNGFGYDPIFVPDEERAGAGRTSAELSPDEKDALSHRGRAFRALAPALASLAHP